MNLLVLNNLAEDYKKALGRKFPDLVVHAAKRSGQEACKPASGGRVYCEPSRSRTRAQSKCRMQGGIVRSGAETILAVQE